MADLLKEIQDIFESCTLEEDNKIRSSVVIEAVTLKYCLNNEVKCALVNKLDPNRLDVTYSKEDLFSVFKDWISVNKSSDDLSPLLFPISTRFCSSLSSLTSTPIGVALGTKSRYVPFSTPHSKAEYSYESDDTFSFDDTHSSNSSTKKSLNFHKSVLESRLSHTENHAYSMEKKYEALNDLFEKQKLELERLKLEAKAYHEMEQCMEECNEQTRKMEKEAEARYSKIQFDLVSANSKIESLESMVTNLNESLFEAKNNVKMNLIDSYKMEHLETEVSRKDEQIQELLKQVNVLERNKADSDVSVSMMMEEKLALSNELNDLRERFLIASQPQDMGIPLYDELPSSMLNFPEDFISSSFESNEPSLSSNRIFTSQESQTDIPKVEDKIFTSQESQTDLPKVEDNIVNDIETTSSCSQTEISIVSNFETTSSCSQTEIRIFTSQETQTNLVEEKVFTSQEAQTDELKVEDKILTSQETQTNLLTVEEKSWVCREAQTEINIPDVHLPQNVKYYLMILLRFVISTMTTSLSILVALFAILIMFLYICQDNRCVPSLRYPRGLPPV